MLPKTWEEGSGGRQPGEKSVDEKNERADAEAPTRVKRLALPGA